MLTIDADRLLGRLAELAAHGAGDDGGVTRLAFSSEDVKARDLVAGWCVEAGLDPVVDAAANLLACSQPLGGDGPGAVMSGSHLDTVISGGRLDGAYGVVAAVEVAHVLHDAGLELPRPLVVVAWADEEGVSGSGGMFGSRAAVGRPNLPVDVAPQLRGAGGDPDHVETARLPAAAIAAYVELHVEQGPVLAADAIPIGVVTAVTGRVDVDVTFRGVAGHAGTTPMDARHDALAAAAEVVLAVERLGSNGPRVATVGAVTAQPGVRNTIPGLVELAIELRDVDASVLDASMARLRTLVEAIGASRGVETEMVVGTRVEPVTADPRVSAAISGAADQLGLQWASLPSGAGHDAQIIAEVAPMGMIFVPSEHGLSHHPGESTPDHELVQGANVLLQAIIRLNREDLLP